MNFPPQLLDLLCAWTSSEDGCGVRAALQSDASLLIDAVYLLRMVHALGAEVREIDHIFMNRQTHFKLIRSRSKVLRRNSVNN